MSDFGYWSWASDHIGSYEQIRHQIKELEIPFAEKKQQLIWRGTIKTNEHRKQLVKVTKGKAWADIKGVLWKNAAEVENGEQGKVVSLPDHCLYQFVIYTEGKPKDTPLLLPNQLPTMLTKSLPGVSYSGRGKYLQNCNSVVIMPKRKWIEPHHTLLDSSNHVEVKDDFSDLEEKIFSLLQNQEKAERIARNGVEVFRDRYLTPAAQVCYWRKMMANWASVGFMPELWGERGVDGKRVMRGTPFETFV